jgi:hypothetical protein
MQLTEHFTDVELGVAGCEQRLIDNAKALCVQLLEPIRAKFGPVTVDDGYRDPGHNARVGGKAASQHLFEGGNSAADIRVVDPPGVLFDWIRLKSELAFDQVILESSGGVDRCVHVSYDRGKQAQRCMALVGQTGDGKVYMPVKVA